MRLRRATHTVEFPVNPMRRLNRLGWLLSVLLTPVYLAMVGGLVWVTGGEEVTPDWHWERAAQVAVSPHSDLEVGYDTAGSEGELVCCLYLLQQPRQPGSVARAYALGYGRNRYSAEGMQLELRGLGDGQPAPNTVYSRVWLVAERTIAAEVQDPTISGSRPPLATYDATRGPRVIAALDLDRGACWSLTGPCSATTETLEQRRLRQMYLDDEPIWTMRGPCGPLPEWATVNGGTLLARVPAAPAQTAPPDRTR